VALETRADADASGGDGVGKAPVDLTTGQVAFEVRGVSKTFRIPTHRITRLKERIVRPFARQEYRQLEALRDVTFEIHRGEFFGIVGRNGSGKSTLLKVMASIYRADAGSVRMAGSVAPFIELGVGFDMELSARENIALNGVMMGLTPKEARGRLDQVLEFAELEDFPEVKLKNYSSGMLVRLGFSVMIQADTDILLIDEVLAVGDAAFQQKCADVFHQMRDRGKTIVLVTHDMGAVEHYCHRAMLLNNGRIAQIGDPGEVARRYLRLNFEQGFEPAQGEAPEAGGDVQLLDVWLEDAEGARVTNVEQGKELRIRALLEARRELPDPGFGFVVATPDDVYVHQFRISLSDTTGEAKGLAPGERVTVSVNAVNQLSPGRYFLHHGVRRSRNPNDTALWVPHALGFVVFGDRDSAGVVAPEYQAEVARKEPG
jgi:ABC-type polysaccharide/polyol phosphate transport system ATPase subunit/cold shock CspA family protein